MYLVASECETGAKARIFCFPGLCSFLFTELNGITGQDSDLQDIPGPLGMNLCPHAQGSALSASFPPLPFMHVNPGAMGTPGRHGCPCP